jgi:hypothetical protein
MMIGRKFFDSLLCFLAVPTFFFAELDLTALANLYQSDKGTEYPDRHHYTRYYQELFRDFTDHPIAILEIGLNQLDRRDCASLRMWLDYFPDGQIYGIDNKTQIFTHPRVSIWIGNQSDPIFLQRFTRCLQARLDIVIDDGSHVSHDQQISFFHLFSFLQPGGLYIIEDLRFQRKVERPSIIKTVDLFYKLKRKEPISLPHIPQNLVENTINRIETIDFYESETTGPDSLVVIRKSAL